MLLTASDGRTLFLSSTASTRSSSKKNQKPALRLETRWKDRDGQPTIVEASRVHEDQSSRSRKRTAAKSTII